MQITVNANTHDVSATNVAEALAELGFAGAAIATALNHNFIAGDARGTTQLSEGDHLEVLAPMQGG